MFLKSYILRTQFVHILYLVNGNHSFTLFPFYLINIFITKLLEEKPFRMVGLLFICLSISLYQKIIVDIAYFYLKSGFLFHP